MFPTLGQAETRDSPLKDPHQRDPMPESMNRAAAIELLSLEDLGKLTEQERVEQLEIMTLEDWSSHAEWSQISEPVQAEMESGDPLEDPMDSRFDAVLLLWIRTRYAAVRNEYLLSQLKELGHDCEQVTGAPVTLEACPCCGLRTIGQRSEYEICPVCWWEDDGQDNADAHNGLGGPNGVLSLTQARINVLVHGLFDPSRADLREQQSSAGKYQRGRVFELSDDGRSVREPARGWLGRLNSD